MKVLLWLLREAGVRDVPSFASLRKLQSLLRAECGIPTHQYKSAQGNSFFMNDLRGIIAKVRKSPKELHGSDVIDVLYRITQTPLSVHTSAFILRFWKGLFRSSGKPRGGGITSTHGS